MAGDRVSGDHSGITVAIAGGSTGQKKSASRVPSGDAYADRLTALGAHVFRTRDGDPASFRADLLILFGNCRSFPRYRQLLRRRRGPRPIIVVWHIEPLPPVEFNRRLEKVALAVLSLFGRWRALRTIEMGLCWPLFHAIAKHGFGRYSKSNEDPVDATMARTVVEAYGFIRNGLREKWLDRVYVSTMGKRNFLASRGIDSTFATAGSHPGLGEDRDLPRDIDVVFIGRLQENHRREKVAAISREIEKRGGKFITVERGCYGEERTALLNRTKIVLNIHRVPWETPWIRWFIAARCGCLVVSEPLTDPQPFEPGVHYEEAPFDALPELIMRLLADPEDVLARARSCAEFVERRMSAAGSIEKIFRDAMTTAARAP